MAVDSCPRCGRPPQLGTREMAGRCLNGPLGVPCGYQVEPAPRSPRRTTVLEKDVMKRAIAWLRTQPDVFAERINVARFGRDGGRQYQSAAKGSADLHVTVCGRALFVECKRPGGKQRPEQRKYQEKVERAGCVYVVEDSPGLETLKAAVQRIREAS